MATGIFLVRLDARERWAAVKRLRLGMTTAEVIAIMGRPQNVSTDADCESWGWAWPGAQYQLTFRQGTVSGLPQAPDLIP